MPKEVKPAMPLREFEKKHSAKVHPLQVIETLYAKDLGIRKDWAAEIAHAVFVGNRDAIYEAFADRLLKGDSRAFNALAARAYGLPQQEIAFSQDKPFKLVIEYVGEKEPETITIEGQKAAKFLPEPENEEDGEND